MIKRSKSLVVQELFFAIVMLYLSIVLLIVSYHYYYYTVPHRYVDSFNYFWITQLIFWLFFIIINFIYVHGMNNIKGTLTTRKEKKKSNKEQFSKYLNDDEYDYLAELPNETNPKVNIIKIIIGVIIVFAFLYFIIIGISSLNDKAFDGLDETKNALECFAWSFFLQINAICYGNSYLNLKKSLEGDHVEKLVKVVIYHLGKDSKKLVK